MDEHEQYELFEKRMHERHPSMFAKPYGGFAIGPGWWPIIESLCRAIDGHTKWHNDTRQALLTDNPFDRKIPEAVTPVVIHQIKEKFGGLRFYYEGGDAQIRGMVTMAEAWASRTCETCGAPGKIRSGGWLRTLCDTHEAQHQERVGKWK